ncbi:hypothetical protein DICPUDRAFT_156336 [Dictyostelium purpureum]|uniref:Uncharacterized protein n=1 Tax=Dictyostelium purpureum TaxID=5786 RepID=F0ZWB4_DICPU|nr:uncharacterized protein DICPUDRAFT_156336 [Dictyostelium purpureum]EGC31759.1 hypothetical protein DICPUDRAFT_156336 [Dictyostelium purpureum]|eukprot:XP_003291710.1 hypothetical protein DICPUDRAFT_156336 [Dictyostelium purpureum]
MKRNIIVLFSLFVFLCLAVNTAKAIVIGIDLGSQTFKVAVIGPNKFETVLNDQSGRKTISQVGWFKDERIFSSDAFNTWARNPKQIYNLVQPFLGTEYQEGMVEKVGNGFLGFKVSNDTERNTFAIQYNDEVNYSPEELTAMLLKRIKDMATAYIGSSVKDCVITIPPFLNQQQRQALLDAADLAGLNVLSLIQDVNAAALSYAVDRTFNDKNQTVVFYDMGSKYTRVSLVEFESHDEPIKGTKKNKTVSSVTVKAIDWDENLGGYDFDMVIVNYLKSLIKKQIPSANIDDVKLTIKLLKEASKMKENLSVNQQAHIFIGSLVDDIDFSASITKKEFEELSKPLVKRAIEPLKRLIERSGISLKSIDYFEVIGGAIRIPSVQQELKEYLKRDTLDKHLNGDESMSSGAAFYAASLTHYFRVKEIKFKDILPYQIDAEINYQSVNTNEGIENTEDADNNEDTATTTQSKDKKIQLFKANSKMGIKKTVSFTTENGFSLTLNNPTINKGIAVYTIDSLPTPGEKYNFTGKPKVHCGFRLTSSGIVVLEKAEAEITVSLIKQQPKPTKETKETKEKSSDDAASEEKPTEEPVIEVEPVIEYYQKTIRVPLSYTVKNLGVQPISSDLQKTMKTRLDGLDTGDRILRELRQERNNLESFIYETRDKVESNDEYISCSTKEERDELLAELEISSSWLSDAQDADNPNTEEYKQQLAAIKKKADKIINRVKERNLIPTAFDELEALIKKVTVMYNDVSKDLNITEEEHKETLQKIETISKWVKEKRGEFKAADLTKNLPFSSFEIKFKLYDLEKSMKEVLKKKKKPVKPTTTKKDKKKPAKKETEEEQSETTEQQKNQDGASEDNRNEQFKEQNEQNEQNEQQFEDGASEENEDKKESKIHDEL